MELNVFASAVLYIAVFLSAATCAHFGQKKNIKTLKVLAVLLPVLLAGFRLTAGTDTKTYRTFYNIVGGESSLATWSRFTDGTMEPTILIFSRLGNALHLSANFLFICYAAITVIFLYATTQNMSRKRAWLYYGMLLFVAFPESLNIMRQMAAVSVQAFALSYIVRCTHDGKKMCWWLVVLLALFSVSLHYSSALLLPILLLPFFVKHIRGRSLFLITLIAALLIMFAFPTMLKIVAEIGILSTKHLNTFLDTKGSIINVKFFACLILAAVFFANYFRRREKSDKEYGFLMLAGTVYSAVGFYSGYVGRLANFFWIFIVVAIVNLNNQLFTKERDRILVTALIAVAYFVLYFVIVGNNQIVPYDFVVGL